MTVLIPITATAVAFHLNGPPAIYFTLTQEEALEPYGRLAALWTSSRMQLSDNKPESLIEDSPLYTIYS